MADARVVIVDVESPVFFREAGHLRCRQQRRHVIDAVVVASADGRVVLSQVVELGLVERRGLSRIWEALQHVAGRGRLLSVVVAVRGRREEVGQGRLRVRKHVIRVRVAVRSYWPVANAVFVVCQEFRIVLGRLDDFAFAGGVELLVADERRLRIAVNELLMIRAMAERPPR